MNFIVYYVIQCGNDDIYVRFFILCLGKAFEKPVKVLFVLTRQLSSKVECVFFLFLDCSKLPKFYKTLQTWKLSLVTLISGRNVERKQYTQTEI